MSNILLNAIEGGWFMVHAQKEYRLVERYTRLNDDVVWHFVYIDEVNHYTMNSHSDGTRKRNLYTRSEEVALSSLPIIKQKAIQEGGIYHTIPLEPEMLDELRPTLEKDIDALLRLPDFLIGTD